ncbi:hypothetical protein [Laribacter hongkongensis]|uniref:hypothetical protein n=1 Tax=Laribacter hongkongensis TaxID=168471 RepID=UPI001EFC3342|nr:hypothetical protein [Laribacter hongkongensis]MCG9095528.1 hypothetical protein [Laribacter hongkongensis]
MEFLMQNENSYFNALQDLPINIGKMSRNKSVPACLPDMQTTKMTKEPDGSFMRKAISPMRSNSLVRKAAQNCAGISGTLPAFRRTTAKSMM